MTEKTGRAIFDYEVDNDLGGVVIKKFWSEDALKAYLTPSSRKAGDIKFSSLVLKTINGYEIIKIATEAFSPLVEEITGDILADISTIVESINLPETITEIAADAFSGIAENLTVQVPETVIEGIDDEVLKKIEDDIGTEVETYVPEPDPNSPTTAPAEGDHTPISQLPEGKDNKARLIGTWEVANATVIQDILTFTETEYIPHWYSLNSNDKTIHDGTRYPYKYVDNVVYIYSTEHNMYQAILWTNFINENSFISEGLTFVRVK
jgi:hypothetical protein